MPNWKKVITSGSNISLLHNDAGYITSSITNIPLEQEITQSTHNFAVGEAIKLSGSIWIKSVADLPANAGTLGVVSEVIDANTFVYQYGGIVATGSWEIGVDYFLSPTTSGSIIQEPSYNLGEVKEYIGTGKPQGLYINIDIGEEITEAAIDEITKVADYTGLAAITGMSNEDLAYVTGEDIEGLFKYDSAQSASNNEGTIIDGWVRQYEGDIIAHWFKGVDNDADMVNRALAAAGSTPVRLTRDITVDRPILMDSNQTFDFSYTTITVPATISDGNPFAYWNGHAVIKNRNAPSTGDTDAGDWGGTGLGGENNITIIGGTIDGTEHNTYIYSGVQLFNVENCVVYKVVCNNVHIRTGVPQGNIDIRNSINVRVVNCKSFNTEKSGIYIESGSLIDVDGVYVTNSGDSGYISINSNYNVIQNSWIHACGTLNNSNATANLQNGRCINNKFTDAPSSTHGFGFTLGHPTPYDAFNTIVEGNLFEGNALNGLFIQGTGSYGNIISDNSFIANGVGNATDTAGGLWANGNLSNLISDNFFKGNKKGIHLGSGVNGTIISDNVFQEQTLHGIHVANAIDTVIKSNIFKDQADFIGVDILDAGTNTIQYGNIQRDGAAYVEDVHPTFTVKKELPLSGSLWRESLTKLISKSPGINDIAASSYAGIAMGTDGRANPYGMTWSTRRNSSRSDFDLVARAHKGTQAGVEVFKIRDNGATVFFTGTTASITSPTVGSFIFNSADANRPTAHNGTEWKSLAYIDDLTTGGITSINNLTGSSIVINEQNLVSTLVEPTIVSGSYTFDVTQGRAFRFDLTENTTLTPPTLSNGTALTFTALISGSFELTASSVITTPSSDEYSGSVLNRLTYDCYRTSGGSQTNILTIENLS